MNAAITAENVTAETKPLKKKKKLPLAVQIILSVVLTLIMLVIILFGEAVVIAKSALNQEDLEKFVDNTNYMLIPITDSNGFEINFYELLYNQLSASDPIDVDFYKLIDQTGIKDTLIDYSCGYISFLLYNDNSQFKEIDEDVIIDIYNTIITKLEKQYGIKMTEQEKSDAEDSIKEQSEIFEMFSRKGIENALGFRLTLIRIAFSVAGMIILGILAAGIFALFILIFKNAYMPFILTGASAAVTGFAGALCSFLAANGAFVDLGKVTVSGIIYQSAAGTFTSMFITVFGMVLAAGIIMIMIGCIIRSISKISGGKKQ